LQYWIGQANIWGELQRETINNKKVSGRNIFVVKEEFRGNSTLNINSTK
jgi:hypothetical protein